MDALEGLQALINESEAERERSAQAYVMHDENLCMLCDAYGEDKRSLFIECFYRITEAVPEALDLGNVGREKDGPPKRSDYFLRICKSCRGRLLEHLQSWRNECVALRGLPKSSDGHLDESDPERNIPVRRHGRVLMLTRTEWDAEQKAGEPVP